jgi:hypothetical protein
VLIEVAGRFTGKGDLLGAHASRETRPPAGIARLWARSPRGAPRLARSAPVMRRTLGTPGAAGPAVLVTR